VAFRSASTATYTFASGSTGSTVDLGANNNYRYINATNVYNKGKSDGGLTYSEFTPSGRSDKTLGTNFTINAYYPLVLYDFTKNNCYYFTPLTGATLIWSNNENGSASYGYHRALVFKATATTVSCNQSAGVYAWLGKFA